MDNVTKIYRLFKDFKKIYNEKGNKQYFFQVNAQNPNNLHESHHRSPFCPKMVDKVKKPLSNLENKKEYIRYMKGLKQA